MGRLLHTGGSPETATLISGVTASAPKTEPHHLTMGLLNGRKGWWWTWSHPDPCLPLQSSIPLPQSLEESSQKGHGGDHMVTATSSKSATTLLPWADALVPPLAPFPYLGTLYEYCLPLLLLQSRNKLFWFYEPCPLKLLGFYLGVFLHLSIWHAYLTPLKFNSEPSSLKDRGPHL